MNATEKEEEERRRVEGRHAASFSLGGAPPPPAVAFGPTSIPPALAAFAAALAASDISQQLVVGKVEELFRRLQDVLERVNLALAAGHPEDALGILTEALAPGEPEEPSASLRSEVASFISYIEQGPHGLSSSAQVIVLAAAEGMAKAATRK